MTLINRVLSSAGYVIDFIKLRVFGLHPTTFTEIVEVGYGCCEVLVTKDGWHLIDNHGFVHPPYASREQFIAAMEDEVENFSIFATDW